MTRFVVEPISAGLPNGMTPKRCTVSLALRLNDSVAMCERPHDGVHDDPQRLQERPPEKTPHDDQQRKTELRPKAYPPRSNGNGLVLIHPDRPMRK